ncbi:MAG: NfeD family protein [Firmicutes bacterium]|nr:NfeD family protein [Bacillota bacterium]
MQWLYIWVGILVAAVIIEAFSMQLMTIWFAIGAICAWIVSVVGGPVWLQWCVFAGVSVLTLILTRPIALKYLNPKREPTNADAVPGKEGIVVAEIRPIEGIGQIKVGGQIWSAKPENGTEVVPVGTRVQVVRIEGVKAVIRVLEQKES